jgi:hypothetical protein
MGKRGCTMHQLDLVPQQKHMNKLKCKYRYHPIIKIMGWGKLSDAK